MVIVGGDFVLKTVTLILVLSLFLLTLWGGGFAGEGLMRGFPVTLVRRASAQALATTAGQLQAERERGYRAVVPAPLSHPGLVFRDDH